MEPRPSGTVTFLFTDIEGSTRRWEAEPSVMEAAAESDMTTCSGRWWRRMVDGSSSTPATGSVRRSRSSQAALTATVEAQRRLTIPVRMGIATGEATVRGGDYFGPALNRTARVMSAGHGGQVLVAASTAALLDGEGLVDLGEHGLRVFRARTGCTRPVQKDCGDEFPPLRTLDANLGNLPAPLTSFVGREVELGEVVAAVREHRPGDAHGSGRCWQGHRALPSRAAARLTPEFRDGVWLVELAAVGDSGAVPDAVANALAVTPAAGT